ncbi:hypothetical protein F5879DRAFT_950086 [Lentinula edodes]|nr:hypothetical protein F5879DRAFT_950086 [Lentinula edodes]
MMPDSTTLLFSVFPVIYILSGPTGRHTTSLFSIYPGFCSQLGMQHDKPCHLGEPDLATCLFIQLLCWDLFECQAHDVFGA